MYGRRTRCRGASAAVDGFHGGRQRCHPADHRRGASSEQGFAAQPARRQRRRFAAPTAVAWSHGCCHRRWKPSTRTTLICSVKRDQFYFGEDSSKGNRPLPPWRLNVWAWHSTNLVVKRAIPFAVFSVFFLREHHTLLITPRHYKVQLK
jgi:hypothetical protein